MKEHLNILTITAMIVAALFTGTLMFPSRATADGATQISGIGYWPGAGECSDLQGADYALKLTGDLEGCLYTFVETSVCAPSGTYMETGRERFVGDYNGQSGTFGTTYRFEAKYQDCANFAGEIIGRCQHPLVSGSGTGIFEGVIGRLAFRDDIQAVNFPYTGHLQ